ncbi:nitronate monooxygenase [Domibacillus sp. DTU_2020_1001157_1_SI_ALB_TIR_016]|uniref:NAD(P)H-dependent flavin oxidoreductase n=1 Tax=Domibacillus sp. DTU_2020_1001157_1_SI_ALB_TIR_016 TaxID=3077789 RepID=UPI0028EAA3F9|nr:nitronate monooxygenase [Domibacillus sp. DTU_2020_1001157_1_SI_ALB_TIR_016]WNS78540.1 nitronate monooxygenase [Domibacillus sp. DTU_2020_1001157_1_SI_ALB_TIR_016]
MLQNEMTKRLNIQYPIIQAPMAGGITTSKLVAEVSNTGGLGMIGAGYMTPLQTKKQIREIKQLTPNPFGVNLFVPNEFYVTEDQVQSANQLLHPVRTQLNIEPADHPDIPEFSSIFQSFTEQISVIIEEKVPVCSFTFGIPSKEVIAELKQHNIILIGTATTVREAIENEKLGMDMVVVQGSEAGGHRGNFIDEHQESLIGLMSLIPQVVDHVSIPVIAAGGIMDGRGLMASICLGAKGVQMGTAFLTCVESGAHKVHKEAILNAAEDQMTFTRSFSGKWARGIQNKFIADMQEHEMLVPDFPVQNQLTQMIRKTSSAQNNQDFMSLWSGQSPRLAKNQTVGALMKEIIEEANKMGVHI